MNMDIFNKYKEIDLKIINSIKNDTEDIKMLQEREHIIKEMLNMDVSKEEMKNVYDEMGLGELDKQLEEMLRQKMTSVKNQMNNIAKNRAANKGYASVNRRTNFFSTNV